MKWWRETHPVDPVRRVRHALAVAVGAGLVLVASACGALNKAAGCRLTSVPKAPYVAKNEQVFRGVPVFPGARLVASYSIGQSAPDKCLPRENGPPYWRFLTWHVYETAKPKPPGTFVRYYSDRLAPRWQVPAWSGNRAMSFRRGEAVLYVMETERGWMMNVDHAAYRARKG